MSKLIAALSIVAMTFGLSYLVMTRAWGLTLQSSAWFICGGIGHLALYLILDAIKEED